MDSLSCYSEMIRYFFRRFAVFIHRYNFVVLSLCRQVFNLLPKSRSDFLVSVFRSRLERTFSKMRPRPFFRLPLFAYYPELYRTYALLTPLHFTYIYTS